MDGLTFASNVLTFIASIVGALAWPSVAIFLLILLRPYLGSLAQHLRELTLPGGVKAVFAEQLEKARQQVEQIEDKTEPAEPMPKTVDFAEPYLELAHKFPEAAILQFYKEVEAASRAYNEKFPSAGVKPVGMVVRGLIQMELIDSETYALYKTIADIRNSAVHGPNGSVTPGEAMEYRTICNKFARILRQAIQNIPMPERPETD